MVAAIILLQHALCLHLSLLLCLLLLLCFPLLVLLLPDALAHLLHFRALPQPMANPLFDCSAQYTSVFHLDVDVVESTLFPGSSRGQISQNSLVLVSLSAQCLSKGHVVYGWCVLGVLPVLESLVVPSSLGHGLGEWSYVLPWYAGKVLFGFIVLLDGKVRCKCGS